MHPPAARRFVIARPMPVVPVTIATRFSNSFIFAAPYSLVLQPTIVPRPQFLELSLSIRGFRTSGLA